MKAVTFPTKPDRLSQHPWTSASPIQECSRTEVRWGLGISLMRMKALLKTGIAGYEEWVCDGCSELGLQANHLLSLPGTGSRLIPATVIWHPNWYSPKAEMTLWGFNIRPWWRKKCTKRNMKTNSGKHIHVLFLCFNEILGPHRA